MKSLLALVALALSLSASPAAASELRLTPATSGPFPARAFLLTLPASTPVSAGQVSITENGAPVAGLSVAPASAVGEGRFGTVLLIETSESMRGSAIESALGAARSFVQQHNTQQPLGIIEFDAQSRVALPLSTEQHAIASVLATAPKLGRGTHIYSAVSAGLQMLAHANVTAGAIVLLSDGALTGRLSNRASIQRKAQVISAAHAQNVRVYAVGVHDQAFSAANLESLAKSAGGTFTEVDSAGLSTFLRSLGAELSNEYLVTYRSTASLGSGVHVVAHVAGVPGEALLTYSAPRLATPAATTTGKRPTGFWHTTAAAVLASVLCAVLIGLAVLAVQAPRRSVRRRVSRFVTPIPEDANKRWTKTLLARAFSDDANPANKRTRWIALAREAELAGIGLSVEQIIALTALGTLALGWALVAATSSAVAAAPALAVPVAVRLGIRALVERQRRTFDEQLPDNLQVVAAAMRAGHTFVGALAIVADDAAEPSRRELRRVLADEQLGVPLADALSAVTERMDSRDFEHVALVAGLQRETGGNTAEVIDTVTETIRERLEVRRLVRTLTAQGRISGWIVASLPVLLLIGVSLINPKYEHPLFHRTAGIIGLGIGAAMIACGFLIVRRIVDIET